MLLTILSLLALGAVLDGGIFGKLRGSVGGITFAVVKGQQVARAKSTPANPRTVAQTANRSRFEAITSAAREFLSVTARPYLSNLFPKLSGYNAQHRLLSRSLRAEGDFADAQYTAGTAPAPGLIYSSQTLVDVSLDIAAPAGVVLPDSYRLHAELADRATSEYIQGAVSADKNGLQVVFPIPDGSSANDLIFVIYATQENGNGGTEVSDGYAWTVFDSQETVPGTGAPERQAAEL